MENKVQIAIEAFNRTKAVWQELNNDINRSIGNLGDLSSQFDTTGRKGTQSVSLLSLIFGDLEKAVGGAVAAFAAWLGADLVKDASMLAARVETLGIVMGVVGNNAGYTRAEIEKYSKGVESMGITTEESRQTVIRMAQANLELGKSAQLARVAQDAAVIANMNSSEALQGILNGITTLQPEVLRTYGIIVNFENEYKKVAASTGRTVESLSAHEKQQLALNTVLEQGSRIAGTYEAAMGTAGKQISSLKRHHDELKLSVGDIFTPALGEGVKGYTGLLIDLNDALKENKSALSSWADSFAEAIRLIVSPLATLNRDFEALKLTFTNFDAWKAMNSKSPVLDPSEQGRLFALKSRAEEERVAAARAAEKQREEEEKTAAAHKKTRDEAAKLAQDWRKVQADLRLDITKGSLLDSVDQQLADFAAKADQLRKKFGDKPLIDQWFGAMTDRTLNDEIARLDKEIEDLAQKAAEGEAEWEAALKRRAEAAQAAQEAEISYQLSIIDTQEKFLQLDKNTAAEQRLNLTRELLTSREQFATGIDRLSDPTGWITQQQAIKDTRDRLLELEFQMKEQTGTLSEGLSYGFQKFLSDAQTLFQAGTELAQRTAQGMEGAFSTFFFDAMTGKLKRLWDYIKGFLEAVAKAVADVMARIMVQQLIGAAIPGAGGLEFITAGPQTMIMHSGGLVPRFHFGGLASDEVPAVLQTRERVLSREQNALFEKFVNKTEGSGDVNITLINQTGQPLTARALPPRQSVRGLVREISLELANTDPTFRSRFNIS